MIALTCHSIAFAVLIFGIVTANTVAFIASAVLMVTTAGIYLFTQKNKCPEESYASVDAVTLDLHRDDKSGQPGLEKLEPENPPVNEHELEEAALEREQFTKKISGLRSEIEETRSKLADTSKYLEASKSLSSKLVSVAGVAEERQRQVVTLVVDIQKLLGEMEIEWKKPTDDSRHTRQNTEVSRPSGKSDKTLKELIFTLEELADQSNVLAINAAIEAARIGSQGKGFSVIAGEMHNLSAVAVELAKGFAVYGETQKAQVAANPADDKADDTLRRKLDARQKKVVEALRKSEELQAAAQRILEGFDELTALETADSKTTETLQSIIPRIGRA